ncbi:MAG: alpha/beta hydrolase [Sphingosinicella sp.]|nr:alpha/beta hydrolase [Sphingosinicella sp.]
MAAWSDGYWESNEGLRLHYRDYPGSGDHVPVICIPGLTRNARDFEGVAERLSPGRRVICVELRGRGESAYAKDPMSYVPLTYLQDMEALLRELKLDRFILFGTSLGGLMTMLLSLKHKSRIAGALINDIGPVLDMKGIERIKTYVGRSQSWPTWMHAARFFRETHGEVFPGWGLDRWLIYAKRVCKLNPNGRIIFDYDMRIAEPFKAPGGETDFDPWIAFRGLADIPLLVVRGAFSDLLTAETLAKMQTEMPLMQNVVIPDVGHAPTLDEPEAVEAIEIFLKRVAP